jgi:aspartokinase/homoserine dehydrogenase 1
MAERMTVAPSPSLTVYKFGGASLEDAAAIRHAASLVARRLPAQTVVVTSALAGVTDALLDAARLAADGDGAQALAESAVLRDRHLSVIDELATGETRQHVRGIITEAFATLDQLLGEVLSAGALAPVMADRIVARGERLAARLFAAAMAEQGHTASVVDATELIRTDGRHGSATPDLKRSEPVARARIGHALRDTPVVLVPGFIGVADDGTVVTLGRGGSDLSATVLGRALQVDEVILWKDVPGVFTADPRAVADARVVAQLHVREAAEMAYYGARVLHPRALTPLTERMRVYVRPFAAPDRVGTEISMRRSRVRSPVKALSAMLDQALVTVSGNGMLGVPGVAARTFGALADAGISVSLISQASSEHSICLAVSEFSAGLAHDVLQDAFASEITLGDIEGIEVRRGTATIAVVGLGMAHTPGIAARVFGALAEKNINIVAIAQGSSELNISVVVDAADVETAQRAIHAAFRLQKLGGGTVSRTRYRDVILLGFGRIGRELVRHLPTARGTSPVRLRIVGIIDRHGFVFDPDGFSAQRLGALGTVKQRSGASVAEARGGEHATPVDALHRMAAHALTSPVLVDLAVGDTRAVVHAAVEHGMDVVLANKVPLAIDSTSARALFDEAQRHGRRVLHEATVGAGLPIIDTVRKLLESGDRVWSIEGCPSGTLGFLFSEMGRGRKFSEALRAAIKAGYTETDPRDDLSGQDVGRKAVILGRLIGFAGEFEDVSIESVVPESLRTVPLDEFLTRLEEADEEWKSRVGASRDRGEVLRYRVRATKHGVSVRLVSVPTGSALASLEGTDNQFTFTTARYLSNPLVITGPGAGPAVTAAGVLNDLLTLTGGT